MSTYVKNGMRKHKLQNQKNVKKHLKSFYSILEDMNTLYSQLDKNIEYTEENINEYVKPLYGRDLDGYEKMLLLGKLHYGKENNI